jgi:16S rRNA G966 N2-methylase RsmD
MVPKFQVVLHASHAALPILNSSKLPPVVDAAKLLVFKIIDKTNRNSKFLHLF